MAIQRPNITLNPAAPINTWPNRGLPKKSIVCHTIGGYFNSLGTWFRDPSAQASTNYGVAMDGRADMYVDPEGPHAPFANGAISNPDAEFTAAYNRNGRQNPNYWTISIEHEDMLQRVQITDFPSMFEASTLIAAYSCQTFNIDPEEPGSFLGHYQIDSVNRPYCPGWTASTWDSYVNEVIHKMTAPGGAPKPPVLTVEQKIEILWGLMGGNGVNTSFIPGQPVHQPDPKKWVIGDPALLGLANDGASILQAIVQLQELARRRGDL